MGARPKTVDGARGRASARSALAGLAAPLTVAALVALWQLVCSVGLVPSFLLPSPVAVVQALVADWPLLAGHAATSLAEAALGLGAGIALGFGTTALVVTHDIDEALELADEIHVMRGAPQAGRPTRIVGTERIDCPRAERAGFPLTPEFLVHKRRVLELLG